MSIKITIPNSSSDVLTFGSGNTPTAAQIAGIDSGSSNGQLALYTTASGTSTERVRVDASGNVGIGTASPRAGYNLTVGAGGTGAVNGTINLDGSSASAQGSGIRFARNSTATGYIGTASWLIGGTSSDLVFSASSAGTEAMRIDSSGNLLVGTTGKVYEGKISVSFNGNGGAGSQGIALIDTNASLSGDYALFVNSAGNVAGRITHNGTTTVAYTTSSDYRLKENIAPMTGALAKVAALKPVTYKWKDDQSASEGFIAHELAEVCPQAVVGGKDAVDTEGNPKYQGIDTSFLVATLTAAIQEQQAIITSLTDRITALEGTTP